jgi:hypothetical protein
MKFTTSVSVELDDLIETMDQGEAEAVIKAVDLAMADYDFTERIAKHLIQALADECTAGAVEFDFSALAPNVELTGMPPTDATKGG